MQRDDLLKIVESAVIDVYRSKGIEGDPVSEATIIYGAQSLIDSLDLVSVVVALEQAILEQTGREITLVDEEALLSEQSPFRTVASLVKLAQERISIA